MTGVHSCKVLKKDRLASAQLVCVACHRRRKPYYQRYALSDVPGKEAFISYLHNRHSLLPDNASSLMLKAHGQCMFNRLQNGMF